MNREDAGKLRGRNVVRIKAMEPRSTNKGNDGEEKDEPKAIDGENKKGRWLSRAGKHSMQANRLINVARRMQRCHLSLT